MKIGIQNILGIDPGTNSVGWALVEIDHDNHIVRVLSIGSRIIPMDPSEISKFENGTHMGSAAAKRREKRQPRRMNERFILRRDRLNCILSIYSMLPEHYLLEIDLETPEGKRCGKLQPFKEPKIAYKVKNQESSSKHKKYEFMFEDSYLEMCADLTQRYGDISKRGIPKDWTLYYLRQKAQTQSISMEELSWVLHSFNQKRGYEKVDGVDNVSSDNELRTVVVTNVESLDNGTFEVTLEDNDNSSWAFKIQEQSSYLISKEGDFKQLEILNEYDSDGCIDPIRTKYKVTEIRQLTLSVKDAEEGKTILTFDNGWQQEAKNKFLLALQTGKCYTFVCTREYNLNGGQLSLTLALVSDENKKANWTYLKLDTETKIEKFNREHDTQGVAPYIYHNLLSQDVDKLHTKIIGGLVESIERKYYHDEVIAILKKQSEYHDEFKDHSLYEKAVTTLYPHNEKHCHQLLQQSFPQLIADDILYFQRELTSKKSEIADCPFETYTFEKSGENIERKVKVAHRNNPFFQEFRIWKFISNLKIYEDPNDEHPSRFEVTEQYLTFDAKASLFEYMQTHKAVKQSILKQSFLHLPNRGDGFSWNYESDHEEKGNETRYEFMWRLRRIKNFDWQTFLDATHLDKGKEVTNEYMLWHFFYAVKRRDQKSKGLKTLVARLLEYAQMDAGLASDIVSNLITFTGYKNEYAAYSEKALMKLLPLMRCGKYWCAEDVEKITGVVDDKECQGLMEYAACEVVYAEKLLNIRSQKWNTPYDIQHYIKHGFKTNSLKNPVVEKVIREMLYIVHDVWLEQLDANPAFKFSDIHIELGRELQKSPKQKDASNKERQKNQLANHRAEMILKEMQLESLSPFMREKYRIYEDCLLSKVQYDKKDAVYNYTDSDGALQQITKTEIEEIQKASKVSKEDINRYRVWLDNRFSSPYTGLPITFTEIFDKNKYQRDHVLPRERVTLNALCNLVMCEAAVNKAKGARTGMQFIKEFGGRRIKGLRILTEAEYRQWVDRNIRDPKRREIMLSEKIPTCYLQTSNQLNNTRYISRFAQSLLSRIVREPNEQEAISKHILPVNGSVTAWLRKDWKLGEVWNEIIAPRFKRMNNEIEKLTGIPTTLFGAERMIHGHNVFVPEVPEQYRDSFEKKRIDHRHHALDALVIALTEIGHIQYINNKSGDTNTSDALAARKALKKKYTYPEKQENGEKEVLFRPPLQHVENGKVVKYKYSLGKKSIADFKQFALNAIQGILVTFKQNNRVKSPRQNVYKHWDEEKGRIVLTTESDLSNDNKWCIRKPISADTIYGQRGTNVFSSRWKNELVNLASNLPEDKEAAKEKLKTIIPDKRIGQTLSNHLDQYENPSLAFTEYALSQLNERLIKERLFPIYKLALLENSEKMHPLSPNGGVKSCQFVKNAKGGNTACYFYKDSIKVLTLDMISQGYKLADDYAFVVAPNDLVYLPSEEQIEASKHYQETATFKEIGVNSIDIDSIYKVSSFDPGAQKAKINFAPSSLSQMIIEDSSGFSDNGRLLTTEGTLVKIKGEVVLTSERSNRCSKDIYSERNIRDVCWKIIISRTGKMKKLITQSGLIITE